MLYKRGVLQIKILSTMDNLQLTKILNNIPVKGQVSAKDLLPDKKPLNEKAYIRKLNRSRRTLGSCLLQRRTSCFLRFIWISTRGGLYSTVHSEKCKTVDSKYRTITKSMEQNVWHVVYLHHSSAQQRTRLEKKLFMKNSMEQEKIYTKMTETLKCGSV